MVNYFSFADKKFGGKFSIFLIIGVHILINLSATWLSIYLAYALSNFSESEADQESKWIGVEGGTHKE